MRKNTLLKYRYESKLHDDLGITRAKVVNNNDPKKIGRIQVRVPSFHGVPELTTRSIKDEDLPWATPCLYGGCGQDFGSFIVPVPGTFVWLMFEDNDVEKPIYLGGVPSIGSGIPKKINKLDGFESPQQQWITEPGVSDVPQDVFEGKSTGVPERNVIYKSQKGHTIMCDDTDGEESLTIIDRLGQLIKFFCGVTKGKNEEKYHRELHSAENDDQLGEGLVSEPSIMIRSGEVKDAEKIHSMIRLFRDHMRGESIDSDNDKKTTTDYSPTEFNQQTQDSFINMTEDHIHISYPNILQEFCPSYWKLTAFEKGYIECTADHLYVRFNGNGLDITDGSVKLHYKDTEINVNDESIQGKAKSEYKFETEGATLTGNAESLSVNAKELKFEGSGKIYTEGGKTYMTGTEIHFNRG